MSPDIVDQCGFPPCFAAGNLSTSFATWIANFDLYTDLSNPNEVSGLITAFQVQITACLALLSLMSNSLAKTDLISNPHDVLSPSRSVLTLLSAWKGHSDILELLIMRGAFVSYNDPHVPTLPRMRHHHVRMDSEALMEAHLASQDCVVILTDHSAYNFQWIVQHSKMVVDTRNATASR